MTLCSVDMQHQDVSKDTECLLGESPHLVKVWLTACTVEVLGGGQQNSPPQDSNERTSVSALH